MNKQKAKQFKTGLRKARSRANLFGTSEKPRLSVHRSLSHIYAQLIDDEQSKTLAAASSKDIKTGSKTEKAFAVGKLIAEKAKDKKIKTCVFDRSGRKFHGRVKAVADGAREAGLEF